MTDIYAGQEGNLDSTARFDRDELVRGWRAYEARTPRVLPLIKFSARTDMGQVRENNEDKFDFYEPEAPGILAERGSFYAVADGIGGALAGQIASEMMLKYVIAGYYDHPSSDLITAMYDAVTQANDRIYGLAQMIPERSGMGTTLVGAIFVEDRTVIVQVGDSRAYLIRDGAIVQVTHDHSWVEEQVRAGLMSRHDAESSPFRNVITRSIGAAPTVSPDFYQEQAYPGDIWVLCSDGLTGYVQDEEILHIAGANAPSESTRQLIELANSRGGRDNITVFVLAVRDLMPFDEPAGHSYDSANNRSAGSGLTENRAGAPAELLNSNLKDSNLVDMDNPQSGRSRSGWRKLFGL